MIRLRFLLATALVLSGAPAAAAGWTPLSQSARAAEGVWRSQGYGRILRLHDGRATLFHVAGRSCYADPGDSLKTDDSFRLLLRLSRRQIATAAAPDQTRYVYDRMPALPAACTRLKAWSRADIQAVVAATFADIYPGFGRPGRDPQALARALAGDTDTDVQLYDRLHRALADLDDAHVGLDAHFDGADHAFEGGEAGTLAAAHADPALGADPAERVKAWGRRYRGGIVGLLDGGGRQVANRRILWGRIGQVGYLNVVAMGAFDKDAAPDDTAALDAALDEAIAAFRGLPGVIVDVTYNVGGYDALSLALASRFADRRRLAFTKQAVDARGPPQRFFVTPSSRARYLGPVVLLTSDITVSAGETFVLAMRALPTVRQVGARTRGALSDQLTKPLPNGWTLTLPAETYRDGRGRAFEGIGVDPDLAKPPFSPSHRSVVAEVAAGMQPKPR